MKNQRSKRVKLFILLFLTIMGVAALYGIYYYFVASRHVTTKNAYVNAEIAQVTPSIEGTVQSIHCKNTDIVKKGDILVILDNTDTQLALSTVNANLSILESNLIRAKLDYKRRINLDNLGAVSKEEISNAKNTLNAAKAAFDAGIVAKKQAKVNLARTVIYSPINGIVAKRQVQLGQRIHVGTTLMSIVPQLSLHVNANFKEVQLKKVRIGQNVKMYADIYGKSVAYKGKVKGISGGTGSAFAIIPAQNATGNWIKVVQRLPVRISLNPKLLKEHPLQVGLSMYVNIDVSGE